MPADTVQKHTELVFSIVDKTNGPLARIAAGVEHLSHKFDHLSKEVAIVAGAGVSLLGAFKMEQLIEQTVEHFEALRRITNITGMAAEKADALSDAFEQAGIPINITEQALMALSRQGQRLQLAMEGIGGAVGVVRTQMMLAGINLKDPEKALLQISDRMHRGKLDAAGLAIALRLDTRAASEMAFFLKQGPEKLRESIKEAKHFAVTAEQMQSYMNYRQSKNELAAALRRASVLIGAEILPLLTRLLRYTTEHVKGWVEHAKEFGEVLHKYLRTSLSTAVTLGKVLLLNAGLTKLTGGGIIEMTQRLVGFGRGKVGLGQVLGIGAEAAHGAGHAAGEVVGHASTISKVEGVAAVAGRLRGPGGRFVAAPAPLLQRIGTGTVRAMDAGVATLGGAAKGLGRFVRLLPSSTDLFMQRLPDRLAYLGRSATLAARAAPGMAARATIAPILAVGAAPRALGAVASAIPGIAGSAMGGMLGILPKLAPALLGIVRVVSVLFRLTLLGAVVSVIVAGVYAIFKNIHGVRDMLAKTWETIVVKFEAFTEALGPVAKWFSADGAIGNFFLMALPYTIKVLGQMVAGFIGTMTRMIEFFKELAERPMYTLKHIGETWEKVSNRVGEREKSIGERRAREREEAERAARLAAARGTPGERGGAYMDFRGSRFDISQNFAEGFDPDRVAVAFAGGLSTMGERKVQSVGFSPLFAPR